MEKFHLKTILQSGFSFVTIAIIVASMMLGCSGGGGDPLGVMPIDNPDGALTQLLNESGDSESDRVMWGIYLLDIRPEEGTASVIPWDRSLEAHFDVTDFVNKPACDNCVRLDNFSFDKSTGIIDLDAALVNPTLYTGYDVRGVVLLDEYNTGRRLETEHGLTDLWSNDPYRPDPFINFAKENPDRDFGPGEEYSAHVTISLLKPYNFVVPYIVDACHPGHSDEPVEMTDIQVTGSVHPTGYDLTISLEILDWQDNIKGIYLDCSRLNFVAGLQPFTPVEEDPTKGASGPWTLELKYDALLPDNWLPTVIGEVELPIVALDEIAGSHLFSRITVDVTEDNDPPQWSGGIGVDEVWWGGRRAIVSYFPASDPSGPVMYNIYYTTDMPLIVPGRETVVGWSHYAIDTVDVAQYTFVVKAEDQAGNEDDNSYNVSGASSMMQTVWTHEFAANLESSPTVADLDSNGVQDVVFGCDDGAVYSLDGDTGIEGWNLQTDAPIKCTPALRDINDDGVIEVITGSNNGNVYAIGFFMGAPFPLATYTTNNMVESSPVCSDQTGDGIPETIVGSFDNFLYAFEGGTGTLLVEYDTGAAVKATPALEDFTGDGIQDIVVNSGGKIRAVNGATGALIWSYDFGTGFSMGSPAIGDFNNDGTGDIVIGSDDGVYCFDLVDPPTLLWSNEGITGNFDTSPALGDVNADGTPDVAITSRFMNVYLLDGTDGSLIWVSDDDIYYPTSPSLGDVNDDGVIDVVLGAADFELRVLNGVDGLTLYSWTTVPYGAITTVPLIADVDMDGNIDIVFGTETHQMIAVTTGKAVPTSTGLLPWPKFMRTRSNTGNLDHPLY